jgi:hypothetical protein
VVVVTSLELGPVLAAKAWHTNGDLVADVARLGYLRPDDRVLDPTFGRGVWWKRWRPEGLVTHDLKIDGVDFRALPHDDASFDAVAFDPPYVSTGGRSSSGMGDMYDRFGIDAAPRTPALLQEMIDAGLEECVRVCRPYAPRGHANGIILVKCQDYISSGRLWAGTHRTLSHALDLELELVDRFERTQPNPRPQPANRVNGKPTQQVHARRNLSTLFVLRRRK